MCVFWRGHSKFQRFIHIVIFFVVLFVIILLLLVFFVFLKPKQRVLPRAIIDLAKMEQLLEGYVDKSVDPCKNFYQFACGTFLKERIMDQNKKHSTRQLLEEEITRQLIDLMEKPIRPNETLATNLVKQLYKLCRNEKVRGTEVLVMQDLITAVGGWPIIMGPNWDKDASWNWMEQTYLFNDLGFDIDHFVYVGVARNEYDRKQYVLTLGAPSRESVIPVSGMYEARTVKDAVELLITNSSDDAQLASEVDNEISLFLEMRKKIIEKRGFSEEPPTIHKFGSLNEINPDLDLKTYVQKMVNVDLKDDNDVQIYNVKFLSDSLKQDFIDEFSPRVLANYAVWSSVIYPFLRQYLTSAPFERIKFTSDRYIYGVRNLRRHADFCADMVNNLMPFGTSYLYLAELFPKIPARKRIEEMMRDFKSAALDIIHDNEWMSPKTLGFIRKKLDAVKLSLGYPDTVMKTDLVNDYYDGVKLVSTNFVKSVLHIRKHKKLRDFEDLTNKNWHDYRQVAKAVISFSELEILLDIPVGGIDLFLVMNHSSYMNYGRASFLIANQLMKSYNPHRSEHGNPGQNFWNETDEKHILDTIECLTNQMLTFEEMLPEPSLRTLMRVLNDNAGIIRMYRAYNTFWIRRHGGEEPVFNLTVKQLFWVSSALPLCAKYRKESLMYFIQNDLMFPPNYRVNNALGNNKEFLADFACKIGSTMNLKQACTVP